MGADHVVSLHEGLHRHLPVGVHHPADVGLLVAVLELELAIVLHHHRAQIVLERLGPHVGVDEHEATPCGDLRRRQLGGILAHAGEIPLAGDLFQRTVEAPAPAVIGAAELGCPLGVVLTQGAAAMQADVLVRVDGVVGIAHHQIRQMRDAIDDEIADIGDIVLAAGYLPDLLPDPLHFEVVIILLEIARGVHLLRPAGHR